LPVFREFWGWAAFAVLAVASLLTVALTTEWNGVWDFTIAVGHRVEPLWVSSAILVYTVTEGVAMLAKAFDRKLRAKYMAEGKAEGKAEGEAETLSALQEAAKRRGADLAEIQDVIEEARKIVRNGRP
jgi:hypothetical protein